MKIVVISGSPHQHGTSAVLVEQFIHGAVASGHQIFRFDAAFRSIHPCRACQICQSNGGQCVQHDDMEQLYAPLIDADAVVFASPVYYNDICGQLKITIDRLFAREEILRKPKRAVLLLSCGDKDPETAAGILVNFRAMLSFFDWTFAREDTVIACGCNTREDVLQSAFPQIAYQMGKQF